MESRHPNVFICPNESPFRIEDPQAALNVKILIDMKKELESKLRKRKRLRSGRSGKRRGRKRRKRRKKSKRKKGRDKIEMSNETQKKDSSRDKKKSKKGRGEKKFEGESAKGQDYAEERDLAGENITEAVMSPSPNVE